jgi:hypothetical protein
MRWTFLQGGSRRVGEHERSGTSMLSEEEQHQRSWYHKKGMRLNKCVKLRKMEARHGSSHV